MGCEHDTYLKPTPMKACLLETGSSILRAKYLELSTTASTTCSKLLLACYFVAGWTELQLKRDVILVHEVAAVRSVCLCHCDNSV